MSDDLRNVKSLVIVFAMKGCGACEDYIPRFTRMVKGFQAYQVPFVFHTGGAVRPGAIPVLVYAADAQDPGVQALADQYKVQALPTTLLLTRSARPVKLEGAIDDEELHRLLTSAALANR
jgi:thiol-disulfide isomerase/thioredoxin